MSLAGQIRIVLTNGMASIHSSRPQLAQSLLAGRTPAEAIELLGLLFSLCGHAQSSAAQLACAAAAGNTWNASELRPAILAEWIREHLWRLLLDWPVAAGLAPLPEALKKLQRAGETQQALAQVLSELLEAHLLGMPATAWLGADWSSFEDWLAAGESAARLFAQPLEGPEAGATLGKRLPRLEDLADDCLASLAKEALEDLAFCKQPRLQGSSAETGALARVEHPLLNAWLARRGAGADARLLARLIELAELSLRLQKVTVARAWNLAEGLGVAGVETSRGLLLHIVQLADGKLRDYRILSPTEWNFHPAGSLAEALGKLPAGEHRAAQAERLIRVFDPCVEYQLEIADA